MITMILKMSAVTTLYVLLTMFIFVRLRDKRLTPAHKCAIGLVYGLCSVLSTHFGVDYNHMMLNVRDIGPLAAGLFFDPVSGIMAGLIGGIERYIVGTYFGVGAYTRIACSVSTCLAGFVAALMHLFIFRRKKPSAVYAFFMGAVMEVFHMYVVLITHRADMRMAFYVVKVCAGPMILFTGIGLAVASMALRVMAGEWRNPFRRMPQDEVPVSHRFQIWLFAVTTTILMLNFAFSYALQTQAAVQSARSMLTQTTDDIVNACVAARDYGGSVYSTAQAMSNFHVGTNGTIDLVSDAGKVRAGDHRGQMLPQPSQTYVEMANQDGFFTDNLFDTTALCRMVDLGNDMLVLVMLPTDEVYADRDTQAYETAFADILLFTVIYVLISMLVQQIVVNNLEMVNASLSRITNGNLDEVVSVRNSSEFASLSNDINQTVSVLKGYIEAAEKRIEQELEFARTIQESALPRNFNFPRKDFEIFASMDPAKEVGGDFYDFFFVGQNRLALVIADVSGKGIPAALFMMRGKTAIRSVAESGGTPAEVLGRANSALCEGNDAEMFITAWIGIINLRTGDMKCASAGHEYPVIMRAGGDYELFKDRHGLALAAMDGVRYREYDLTFRPGDRLFVYTDGIPEAIDENVEQYGVDRLVKALNRLKDVPMAETLPAVRQDIRDFVGKADQFDDITMLGFTYFGTDDGRENHEGMDI